MSIYKSTQYGWSNIETYIVSLYNDQNDFFISKIIILSKISKFLKNSWARTVLIFCIHYTAVLVSLKFFDER